MRILFLLCFCSFAGADPRVNEKILGGHKCKADEAQYYVSICKGRCDTRMDIICGGTLIRPDWVLTAAHCDLPDETLKVISDAHDVQNIIPAMIY
ncbi:kallikrein-14-like [Arapaima gigas]